MFGSLLFNDYDQIRALRVTAERAAISHVALCRGALARVLLFVLWDGSFDGKLFHRTKRSTWLGGQQVGRVSMCDQGACADGKDCFPRTHRCMTPPPKHTHTCRWSG